MDAISMIIFLGVIVVLLVLMALRVPIAIALVGSSFTGLVVAAGFGIGMSSLGNTAFNSTASYSLAVIPLFIMMGSLATRAGLATDLFDIAERHLGRLPGGLALASIAACAGFSAITGSSTAAVASIGKMTIEEMAKHGYNVRFASGVVATAGTLGVMIPPSIILVLMGVVSNTSIGQLLIAGIIPGIASAILYAILTVIMVLRNPALAGIEVQENGTRPLRSSGASRPKLVPLKPTKYLALPKVVILFGVVVVGVYTGFYTATEAGAIGALAALILLVITPSKNNKLRRIADSFVESSRLTSSIFLIVAGGALLSILLVSLNIPRTFADWASTLTVPTWILLAIILALMIPLGMFLDSISIVLVFIPIVYPIVEAAGVNPIVFGILAVKMIELGLVTPPVGVNAYVVAASTPVVSAEDVFRGVIPFFIADLVLVVLVFLFPETVLFLPQMMVA